MAIEDEPQLAKILLETKAARAGAETGERCRRRRPGQAPQERPDATLRGLPITPCGGQGYRGDAPLVARPLHARRGPRTL